MRLLDLVQPTDDDRLIFLGDYVDRGPGSKQVIDWLISERAKRRNMVTIRGNHEIMMMHALGSPVERNFWLTYGGIQTLDSYGTHVDEDWAHVVPNEHWRFMIDCAAYYETDTHIFVHAGADANLAMDKQDDRALYWDRVYQTRPHQSGKLIVCGHTAQREGEIYVQEGAVCIDTFPIRQWLTCLDVDTGEYWQAAESHDETQTGRIELG
jgi:serine/threonine protein phosphatase 1